MIPVEDKQLIKVDLKENKKDTPAESHYKQLCIDELTWCRKNAEIIINKANCLYNLCMGDSNYKGKTRCLDFTKLEKSSASQKEYLEKIHANSKEELWDKIKNIEWDSIKLVQSFGAVVKCRKAGVWRLSCICFLREKT